MSPNGVTRPQWFKSYKIIHINDKIMSLPYISSIFKLAVFMMTSSNGNVFRVTGPLCGEFIGHRWIPRTKGSDKELWCFLWSAPWIHGWVNNREAGDLRHQRSHYDVMVMYYRFFERSFRYLDFNICVRHIGQACGLMSGSYVTWSIRPALWPTAARLLNNQGPLLLTWINFNLSMDK